MFEQLSDQKLHYLNETFTRLAYQKALSPGDHAIDLGANLGHHTRGMLAAVGPTGLVHAFEPNPDLFAGLLGTPNVRLWPFAAGEKLEKLTLQIPDGLDGWASFRELKTEVPDRRIVKRDTVTVAVDDLEEIDRDKVKFVKVDVETWEEQALRGMACLISAARPSLVIENVTSSIAAWLSERGYTVVHFDGSPWQPQRHPLPNSLAAAADRVSSLLPSPGEMKQALDSFGDDPAAAPKTPVLGGILSHLKRRK